EGVASQRRLQPGRQVPHHQHAGADAARLAPCRRQAHAHVGLFGAGALARLDRGRQIPRDLRLGATHPLAVRRQGWPHGQAASADGAVGRARRRRRLSSAPAGRGRRLCGRQGDVGAHRRWRSDHGQTAGPLRRERDRLGCDRADFGLWHRRRRGGRVGVLTPVNYGGIVRNNLAAVQDSRPILPIAAMELLALSAVCCAGGGDFIVIDRTLFRRLAFGLLTGAGLAVAAGTMAIAVGSFSAAQAQVSVEFQEALTPYGSWRRHGRWGEVWVPSRRQGDWRPYQAGHWVYTEEWGWFWDTDDSEADWGWITYHYGRWMHDESGWFWIPGDEWAPAWVDWRYSDDYVGWAPLPPDDVEVEYESQPTVWVFVAPRYLTEPRWRTYVAPPQERVTIFRSSRIVNRTVVFQERGRAAVNPGISPAFIASVTHRPVQSYRVSPHVVASTRGVAGAVTVRPQDLRGNGPRGARSRTTITRVSVQKTNVVIKPEAKAPPAPQALGKGEKGRLGNRPPRAAQGAVPANGQPPAGERPEQRPGQAAPNGQQRPNVT